MNRKHGIPAMPAPTTDTIVAVSSPPGRSYRGLIRIAGHDALAITRAILAPTDTLTPRRVTPVRLLDPPIPALLTYFRGPHSYTGDDLVELQLPGNAALLDRILHQLTTPGIAPGTAGEISGGRLAEPGEFTFRAYLEGKLTLTEAEGVGATISATSDAQLAAATMLRQGKLAALARRLVDDLGSTLALVEAGIDFVDQDDVVPIPADQLAERLHTLTAQLRDLLRHSRSWGAIEALPRVVLVGPPSAGKSTLFNALLGHTRAVVHDLPGTTRDVLAEPLRLKRTSGRTSVGASGDASGDACASASKLPGASGGESVEVMLIDIAGLDRPGALLDRAAQHAAQREIDRADLLLVLGDAPLSTLHPPLSTTHTPTLHIHPKADLSTSNAPEALPVSAHTGQNLDTLRDLIAQHVADRGVTIAGQTLALQPRHESALRDALAELTHATRLLYPSHSAPPPPESPHTPLSTPHTPHPTLHTPHPSLTAGIELIADRLRQSLNHLAALGGELTPDDVIGKVFATFCVGK